MKKNRTVEKLKLNRETVRLLDERGLAEPVGAASTGYVCSICPDGCTVTHGCSNCRPCL